MKAHKIPDLESVKTVKVIQRKSKGAKDPVRNPKVLIPLEKKFTDGYLYMQNNMVKMIQVEMLKQLK